MKSAHARLAAALAAVCLLAPTWALAGSTINPTQPAQSSQLSSAVVRGNFAAAYADVNNILGGFAGTSSPGSTTVFQDWLDTSASPAVWKKRYTGGWGSVGVFNLSTGSFTPTFGSPLLAWQQLLTGGGGLGTSGQCVTSTGASTVPTMQNCVSPTSITATAPIVWNSGTRVISFNYATAGTFTALQTVDLGTGAAPAADAGAGLHVLGADATTARVEVTTFGIGAALSLRASLGTRAAPTALTAGMVIGSFNVHGYDGAAWTTSAYASVRAYAHATWTSTSHPTRACLATTAVTAAATNTDGLCQYPDGGVAIAAATGGSQGAGTVNATGLYVNGVAVASSATAVTSLTTDVVATGPGAAVATIQAGVVTYAKIQTVAASSLVGNPTGGLATSQAVSLGATLAFSGTALQTVAHTGDVTTPANSFVTTLATAQPAVHTWALAQTFTVAPVFTDQSGSRTALGLGTAATQNTGTSGATLPFLNGTNTWSATNAFAAITATSLNGNTFTTGTYTLTGTAGKTLTFSNSITIAGTDATTVTFPSVSSTIPRTVASGATALNTAAIASGACNTTTAAATGVASTDAISGPTFNASVSAVTGYTAASSGALSIRPYPTAGNVNFEVCNGTVASITPGAVTLNWSVFR